MRSGEEGEATEGKRSRFWPMHGRPGRFRTIEEAEMGIFAKAISPLPLAGSRQGGAALDLPG